MQVLLFALCESFNPRGSRLDIIGIYHQLGIKLPSIAGTDLARLRTLCAILKIQFGMEDEGSAHRFGMRLIDVDGAVLCEAETPLDVPVGAIPEGKYMIHHHVFEVSDVVFPKFGEYSVDLLHDGETILQWPLLVSGHREGA